MFKRETRNYLTEYRTLVNKLNQKKFYGLNGINVGYTIAVPFQDMHGYTKSFRQIFKMLIGSIIFDRYKLNMDLRGKMLFFQRSGSDPVRRQLFYNLSKLVSNSCYGRAYIQTHKKILPIGSIIKHCLLAVYFYFKLWHLKLSLTDCFIFVSHLLILYIHYNLLKNVNFISCDFLVTYCDTESIESILTQMFRQSQKITTTLQHGYFMASDINGQYPHSVGVSYETMISDYFLCWGKMTKNQAFMNGVRSNIICVGALQFIDYKKVEISENKHVMLGIFLTGCVSKEFDHKTENEKLILVANEFCEMQNKKFKIRSHPSLTSLTEAEYNTALLSEYCAGFSPPDEKLSEFAAQVDICLIGNTSCFVELLYLDKIVFKLFHPLISIYDGIDDFLVHSADDICIKLKNIDNLKQKSMKIKHNYITAGDTRMNYISAFRNIVEGK